ncbi:hypothetical protein D3C86_2163990 [compost metagenome]
MKSASGSARSIIAVVTIQSLKARLRASFSASKPMLVQTSVVTRLAPWQAVSGSSKTLTRPAADAGTMAGSSW